MPKKDSNPSSPFLKELHESMSGFLQEIFESRQKILSLAEDAPFVPLSPRSDLLQKDLKALQTLCQSLLHQLGHVFRNADSGKGFPALPSEDASFPLQEKLQRTWSLLQKGASQSKHEMVEMEKWIHVALKQVEKSLDLMNDVSPK